MTLRKRVDNLLESRGIRMVGFGEDVDPFGEPYHWANPHFMDWYNMCQMNEQGWPSVIQGFHDLGYTHVAYHPTGNRIVFK